MSVSACSYLGNSISLYTFEQSGKSTPCCRRGKLSCVDVCLSVKKLFLAE